VQATRVEGEDAELALLAAKLVARATGEVIRADDVRALGLPTPVREEPSAGGLKLVR
jgi:hypothetical protein